MDKNMTNKKNELEFEKDILEPELKECIEGFLRYCEDYNGNEFPVLHQTTDRCSNCERKEDQSTTTWFNHNGKRYECHMGVGFLCDDVCLNQYVKINDDITTIAVLNNLLIKDEKARKDSEQNAVSH